MMLEQNFRWEEIPITAIASDDTFRPRITVDSEIGVAKDGSRASAADVLL